MQYMLRCSVIEAFQRAALIGKIFDNFRRRFVKSYKLFSISMLILMVLHRKGKIVKRVKKKTGVSTGYVKEKAFTMNAYYEKL